MVHQVENIVYLSNLNQTNCLYSISAKFCRASNLLLETWKNTQLSFAGFSCKFEIYVGRVIMIYVFVCWTYGSCPLVFWLQWLLTDTNLLFFIWGALDSVEWNFRRVPSVRHPFNFAFVNHLSSPLAPFIALWPQTILWCLYILELYMLQ